VSGVFKISSGNLGPCVVRAIIVLAYILVYFLGNPTFSVSFGDFSAFDVFVLALAALLFGMFTVSTLTRARELARVGE
jgi:hypothetical protein